MSAVLHGLSLLVVVGGFLGAGKTTAVLGAGKTTAVLGAANRPWRAGRRTAIITKDQGVASSFSPTRPTPAHRLQPVSG